MKSPNGLDANLPVGDLLKDAFDLIWQKRVAVARLFWPLIVILAAIDVVNALLPNESRFLSVRIGLIVVSVMFSVLMATTAHRFTLLDGQSEVKALRRWDKSDVRYVLRLFQIILIAMVLISVLAVSAIVLLAPTDEQVALLMLVAVVPVLYVWSRLSITLPEIALGKYSSLKRALAMSHGNGWRLTLVVFGVPILLMLPFLAIAMIDSVAAIFLAGIGSYIGTLLSVVLLSNSYRFLQSFFDADAPVEDAVVPPQTNQTDSGFDA